LFRERAKKPSDGDFVDKALFQFDHVLDVVHDRVLRPILLAGRALAYGLIILFAALFLIGALLIGLIRFIDITASPDVSTSVTSRSGHLARSRD